MLSGVFYAYGLYIHFIIILCDFQYFGKYLFSALFSYHTFLSKLMFTALFYFNVSFLQRTFERCRDKVCEEFGTIGQDTMALRRF